jgi:hypothetical protein
VAVHEREGIEISEMGPALACQGTDENLNTKQPSEMNDGETASLEDIMIGIEVTLSDTAADSCMGRDGQMNPDLKQKNAPHVDEKSGDNFEVCIEIHELESNGADESMEYIQPDSIIHGRLDANRVAGSTESSQGVQENELAGKYPQTKSYSY